MSMTSSNSFSSDINDYELLAEIGVGSFGRVYEAICKSNDTKCAVKKISKCSKGHRGHRGHGMAPSVSKIKTEVSIHSRLIHSNICQLFKVIEDESNVYLILELCSGGSLKDLIKAMNQVTQSGSHGNNDNRDGIKNEIKIRLNRYEKPTTGNFRRTRSDGNLRESGINVSKSGINVSKSGINVSNNGTNNRNGSMLGKSEKDSIEPVIPYELIRIIMKQIIAGLSYLHRNKIIHRDLNINNILLKERIKCIKSDLKNRRIEGSDNRGLIANSVEVKIVDFGLALDTDQITFTPDHYVNNMNDSVGRTICGTPGFISPEVWKQSSPISTASDIFSLGSILYSLISGNTTPSLIHLDPFPSPPRDTRSRDTRSRDIHLDSFPSLPRDTRSRDIHLDSFPSLPMDLVSTLLQESPSNRLSLNQILSHPFMIGPLNTDRLRSIVKITKSLNLTLTPDGSVQITFFKSNVKFIVQNGSGHISILHGISDQNSSDGNISNGNFWNEDSSAPVSRENFSTPVSRENFSTPVSRENCEKKKRVKPPEVYTLENLAPNHWKKYVYASKFVNLIRDKTPKVIYHCNQARCQKDDKIGSVNAKVSSLDFKGDRFLINKVTLMENNAIFEANILNVSTNEEFKLTFHPDIKEKYSNVLYQQMVDLYSECLTIESNMDHFSSISGSDYFPVTIGKRLKNSGATSPMSASPSARMASTCAISTFSPSINFSTISSSPSMTSSPSLRSVQIKNIGIASQLSDGIEVRFNDGSSLVYKSTDSNVIYSETPNGPMKRYFNPRLIPPFVRDKLQLARQAINELKGKSSNLSSIS